MTQLRGIGGHGVFLTGFLSHWLLLNLTAAIEISAYMRLAMTPEEEDAKGLPFNLRLANCVQAFAMSSALATFVTYPIEFYNIRVILRTMIVSDATRASSSP